MDSSSVKLHLMAFILLVENIFEISSISSKFYLYWLMATRDLRYFDSCSYKIVVSRLTCFFEIERERTCTDGLINLCTGDRKPSSS
jgi:hypothetical protein